MAASCRGVSGSEAATSTGSSFSRKMNRRSALSARRAPWEMRWGKHVVRGYHPEFSNLLAVQQAKQLAVMADAQEDTTGHSYVWVAPSDTHAPGEC